MISCSYHTLRYIRSILVKLGLQRTEVDHSGRWGVLEEDEQHLSTSTLSWLHLSTHIFFSLFPDWRCKTDLKLSPQTFCVITHLNASIAERQSCCHQPDIYVDSVRGRHDYMISSSQCSSLEMAAS